MNKAKKLIKIFLGVPLTIIAFIFIGKILYDSLPQIVPHLLKANPILLFIGLFFMLLFFLLRSVEWTKILEFYGENEKGLLKSIYYYSIAETKRYIPGNIFSFISRIEKFSSESIPRKTILKALALEAFIMVASALIVAIPTIIMLPNFENYLLIVCAAFVVFVIFLVLAFKNVFKLRDLVLNIFPKKSVFEYIHVVFLSGLAWSFFGLANFFFMTAIFPSDPNLIFKLVSVFVLSWLIGYLSFIAPMGLGVREAALIFLLSPFIPLYAGATIAIFTRLFFVVSEVIFLGLSFLVHQKVQVEQRLNKLLPILIVATLAFCYIVYFTFLSIARHAIFYSGKFDLGNMENTVWNTLQGNFFMFSNPDGANELSRLSAHADFILLFFTPLYAIYPSVNLLLITQTLVIGLGGFFVYLIAKKVLNSEKLSILFSVGYFLNFFIHEQNIFDFHAVSMATTFLLGAFYFILEKKYRWSLVFLALAVLTKENVYLVAALMGGFIFLRGQRVLGVLVFSLSIIVFLFLMAIAIPNARGSEHFALEYLSYLGSSSMEIILSPFLKPEIFFGRLFSFESFDYARKVFLPVGYLSLLSPLYLILMLPDFLINVLSDNPNLRSIQYHYGALLVPFIYISAIYGAKRILSFKFLSSDIMFYFLLSFILYSTYQFSPLPGTKNSDIGAFKSVLHSEEIIMEVNKIPVHKSVSATNNIAAHLVQREKIYVFPNGMNSVDYLVFYKNNLDMAQEFMTSENFVTVFNDYDLIILKRITPPERAYVP